MKDIWCDIKLVPNVKPTLLAAAGTFALLVGLSTTRTSSTYKGLSMYPWGSKLRITRLSWLIFLCTKLKNYSNSFYQKCLWWVRIMQQGTRKDPQGKGMLLTLLPFGMCSHQTRGGMSRINDFCLLTLFVPPGAEVAVTISVPAGCSPASYAGFSKFFRSVSTMDTDVQGTWHQTTSTQNKSTTKRVNHHCCVHSLPSNMSEI